jgi:CMP-2-keto-3-deoxyoctulosonic acid synthetase
MREITNIDDISNPNNVKVVVDQNNFALYFSRSLFHIQGKKMWVFATCSILGFMLLENKHY